MKLFPETEFSKLDTSKTERFWLWLAELYERWRGVSFIVAIGWTVVLILSNSGTSNILLFVGFFPSWVCVLLGYLSHSILQVLRRHTDVADPNQSDNNSDNANKALVPTVSTL